MQIVFFTVKSRTEKSMFVFLQSTTKSQYPIFIECGGVFSFVFAFFTYSPQVKFPLPASQKKQ